MRSFILLFLPVLIFSCTPKKNLPAPEEQGKSEISQDSDASKPSFSLKRKDDASLQKEEIPKKDQSPEIADKFSGPLFLQRIKPHTYLLTDSLIVGKQADPLSPLLSEREADYLVRDFLNGYREGRVKKELFTENVHPLFLKELEQFKKEGLQIQDFFLGAFSQSGDRSQVQVVLFSETGFIKGSFYMQSENGLWGIQDWEMPLNNWPGDPLPVDGDLLSPQ